MKPAKPLSQLKVEIDEYLISVDYDNIEDFRKTWDIYVSFIITRPRICSPIDCMISYMEGYFQARMGPGYDPCLNQVRKMLNDYRKENYEYREYARKILEIDVFS